MCASSTFGHLLCLLFSQPLKPLFPSCSIPCVLLKSPRDASCLQINRPDLVEHPAASPMGHHAASVTASGWQWAQRQLVLSVQKVQPIAFHRGTTHELLAPLSPWPKRSLRPISAEETQLVAAQSVFLEESWAGNTFPILHNFSCSLAGWN